MLQALLQILTKASTNTVLSVVANAVNRKMFQSSLQIHNSSIIANSLITRKQALLQLSANTVAVNDANTVTSESRRFASKSKLTPLTFDWGGCLCSDTFQGMWLWRWSSLDIWTNFHAFDCLSFQSALQGSLNWKSESRASIVNLQFFLSFFSLWTYELIALACDDAGEDEDLKFF